MNLWRFSDVQIDMGSKRKTWIVLIGGALVAAMALPSCVSPPRNRSAARDRNICIANLKEIQAAVEQYSLENKLPAVRIIRLEEISGGPGKLIYPLINAGLRCPDGGTYSVTTAAKDPQCSVPGHSFETVGSR
jgi:hypothetical protein